MMWIPGVDILVQRNLLSLVTTSASYLLLRTNKPKL